MAFQPQLAAQDEFRGLTRLGVMQGFLNRLLGRETQLHAFEIDSKRLCAPALGRRSLQDICLAHVVGSVGRAQDYTPTFLPRQSTDEARWVRVRLAAENEGLPPIEVYQLGEDYYVLDGHHRVSVLKRMGVGATEAYVTQVSSPWVQSCAC
jgi:hypothetical protein